MGTFCMDKGYSFFKIVYFDEAEASSRYVYLLGVRTTTWSETRPTKKVDFWLSKLLSLGVA